MILNIYKPKNWTSFDVVAKVRSVLREIEGREVKKEKKIKVGHAGTLDPLATGVLIVLTHEDTKKQEQFMKMPKKYVAEIALGLWSETYDLEGNLVKDESFSLREIDLLFLEKEIEAVLPNFVGSIEQRVPAYSVVKIKGKPLYKRARVENIKKEDLPVKRITIYNIKFNKLRMEKVIEAQGEYPVFELEVKCSSGTYIRSLANDIGEELGTTSVLTKLERTEVGKFNVDSAIKIENLEAKILELHAQ